jgi:periplasmic copper chaperone A
VNHCRILLGRALVIASALGLAAAVVAGCGSDRAAASGLEVSGAVIPLPAGENAALYFTVENGGDPVELVDMRSTAASTLVMHQTIMEDGLLVMEPIEGPLVFDSGTTALEPGGLHVMLVGVADLSVGDVVPVDLEWGDGSLLRIDATVVDIAATVHDHDDPAQHGPGADHQHD